MFDILFIVVPIFVVLVFIFVIAQIVSPRFSGKMLSKQIKSIKYMMEESKDDIESISTDMANATKEGIKTTASAIKDGFSKNENIECRYCRNQIDKDSKFCKNCGTEQ